MTGNATLDCGCVIRDGQRFWCPTCQAHPAPPAAATERSYEDIWLAAYLLARHLQLLRADRKENGYMVFVFAAPNQDAFTFESLEADFANGGLVNVTEYAAAYRHLRSKKYQGRERMP